MAGDNDVNVNGYQHTFLKSFTVEHKSEERALQDAGISSETLNLWIAKDSSFTKLFDLWGEESSKIRREKVSRWYANYKPLKAPSPEAALTESEAHYNVLEMKGIPPLVAAVDIEYHRPRRV